MKNRRSIKSAVLATSATGPYKSGGQIAYELNCSRQYVWLILKNANLATRVMSTSAITDPITPKQQEEIRGPGNKWLPLPTLRPFVIPPECPKCGYDRYYLNDDPDFVDAKCLQCGYIVATKFKRF